MLSGSQTRRVNSDSTTDLHITAGCAGYVFVAAAASPARACSTMGRPTLSAAQPHERDNPKKPQYLFSVTLGNRGGTTGRESLVHTAATALEMGKAWVAPLSATLKLVQGSEGLSAFDAAVTSPRGVILLAPHLSNWEIFGFFACEGRPANFMYQPPQNEGLDNLLRTVRSRNGVNLAPTNRKGVAQLLSALKRGEIVGILPDQVPTDAGGAFADFFGEPALTMTLVSKLIQRTGAQVFCGFAERLPNGRGFVAVFEPANEAIYSVDLQESLEGLNRSVESIVNRALPQYQWEYKRFRRRPDNSEFY